MHIQQRTRWRYRTAILFLLGPLDEHFWCRGMRHGARCFPFNLRLAFNLKQQWAIWIWIFLFVGFLVLVCFSVRGAALVCGKWKWMNPLSPSTHSQFHRPIGPRIAILSIGVNFIVLNGYVMALFIQTNPAKTRKKEIARRLLPRRFLRRLLFARRVTVLFSILIHWKQRRRRQWFSAL